ncbi:MAG: hypothetical protein HOQ28_08720 [Thermoleophilia bacterium]|nr:hypothetical protein [Thermoleophilia bacterium]
MPRAKAPLALAGFLALPLFFAALMAASLAIEKPRVVEWSRPHGRIARIYHDASGSLEVKIWLLALVVALFLVAAGWLASFVRYGVYVTCVAAVVEALALTVRLDRWEGHHTSRFPQGEDLLSDDKPGSLVNRGQWEHEAARTAHSLVNYTIALALIATAIVVVLAVRRKRGPLPVPPPAPPQTGGAPTTSGL